MLSDLGVFTSENEIFDDHYGFSGNELVLGVEAELPGSVHLDCSADHLWKKYTIPAKDLSDSVVIADNRVDRRLEVRIGVSRTFQMGGGRSLKPRGEVHFLRNSSNAPYYDFDKKTYLVGIEFNF